jgi:hypothetical protein
MTIPQPLSPNSQESKLTEQPFSLPVYLLGYPIALAGIVVFYVSEVFDVGVRKIMAINRIVGRK